MNLPLNITTGWSIIPAEDQHLFGTKKLSDAFKRELGFVNRAILQKAIAAGELLVAVSPNLEAAEGPEIAGFVHFYTRRDESITLYSIVVAQEFQGNGLGRQLFEALCREAQSRDKTRINLKCPTELKANLFYEHLGLEIIRVEDGKLRPLNVWSFQLS